MVETLDCKGQLCPMPIVQLTKKIKTMKVGDVVEMVADDLGSKEDVPAWCRRTGNELLDLKEDNGVFTFRVKRLK